VPLVATPPLLQARNHYHQQSGIVSKAVLAIRALFTRRAPLSQVVATVSAYQMASARASALSVAGMAHSAQPFTNANAFTGVSSLGFPVAEPIIATIDKLVPAPAEPFPAIWWDQRDVDAFLAEVEQLVASEVADAGRTASQVEFVARPLWTNYVRVLQPPSCKRCAILAGRIYRDLEAFKRHPECDCVMVPVEDWDSAHDEGYVFSFQTLFERGQVRGLSEADAQAIRDGADPAQVVNATRGLGAPGITAAFRTDLFGHKVKATTDSTTKRAAWRRANPTRLVRLRPESVYEFAKDRDDAIRLLRLYGYLTS
jgi:hypothetical protein